MTHVRKPRMAGFFVGFVTKPGLSTLIDRRGAGIAQKSVRGCGKRFRYRALKRTRFKVFAVAVVVAVLVSWFAVANYQYLAMAWMKACAPENVRVSSLCHAADGSILFSAELTDRHQYEDVLTKYIDGVAYVNFRRQVLPSADQSQGFDEWWVDLHTVLRDGVFGVQSYHVATGEPDEFRELTVIRIGTPDDYVTVWEKGTEISLADAQTLRQFQDFMGEPND